MNPIIMICGLTEMRKAFHIVVSAPSWWLTQDESEASCEYAVSNPPVLCDTELVPGEFYTGLGV